MKKILVIAPYVSSFIQKDIDMLSQDSEVIVNLQNWKTKSKVPFNLIRQLFYLLSNLSKFDVCIVQFAGYWSYLPTKVGSLFKVPTFIVLHGSDCAAMPSVGYGNLRKNPLKWFIKKTLVNATELWPVSRSLISTKNTYYPFPTEQERKQGYENILGPINTNSYVISNGLDFNFWKATNHTRKKNSLIAVIGNGTQFTGKGIDLVMEVAPNLPEFSFSIVGMDKPTDLPVPSNVKFLGRISQEKLIDLYSQHQFYLQLSRYEGFGLALCEAMLCKCIPVVSDVNILPEIVKDAGFVLKQKDVILLRDLLNSIQSENLDVLQDKAREAITSRFDIQNRIKEIYQRINHYTK